MADMDDLLEKLTTSQVDPTALGAHPRFTQYKNVHRAEQEQRRRREEALERQRQRRFDFQRHARKLADDNCSDSEEEMEAEDLKSEGSHGDVEKKLNKRNRVPGRPYKNRYADQLMFSEWLVDIPEQLSSEWIMIPAPVGKRVLVVASRGVTTIYNKAGKLVHQFRSELPCKRGSFTILDCILSDTGVRTIYVIDALAWNDQILSDLPFNCRRFFLHSRISEDENILQPSKKQNFVFAELPQCSCEKSAMEELVRQQEFEIDGLLFYYSDVLYIPGQSPLVGWLKPFMMPSILGVSVPDKYLSAEDPKEFIRQFNEKHGHRSKIGQEKEEEHEVPAHEDEDHPMSSSSH